MNKYLEYYQFHEKDEDGNILCLYCIVKSNDNKVDLQFISDYDEALEELRNFAYDNKIHNVDELKNSSRVHLQATNKEFRNMLENKYDFDTSNIDNFNEVIGHVKSVENPIDFGKILNPKPTKKNSVIEKLKNLKIKGVKKLAVRLAIIASAGFLGFAGIKGCSKKGTTDDLEIDQQMIDAENETKNNDSTPLTFYSDVQDANDINTTTSNLSNFQIYLNQSSEATKNYMNAFKETLGAFNSVARNYIDASKNSRLGLDVYNYTAFKMSILGENFGNTVDNVSTYWYRNDLYHDYVKTNHQIKQLATVQQQRTGLAKALDTAEQQEFYQKYEDMIIDLNKTTDDNEKIAKAENILSQIKTDFNMDSDNFDPETLLKSDPKYVAVMPMIRSVYDRAKNSNYENLPDAERMNSLSKTYRAIVKGNIFKAADSIEVKESITPSYEMFMTEIANQLDNVNLYVIDEERNIKDTELYKQNKTLPVKAKEETQPTTNNSDIDVETLENTGVAEVDIPDYSTDDDNYDYQEEEVSDDTVANENDTTEEVEETVSDDTPQIIETDEGTVSDTIDNSDNTTIDNDQIIESEEDVANSMNDAISNGGYAETPDGWQIDDDYKIDGTDVIDGSVSDITVEDYSTDVATEEVPTTTEPTEEHSANEDVPVTTESTDEYNITESEENYNTPQEQPTDDQSVSEESVITEETPVYDETTTDTNDYTVDNTQYTDNQSDITTYEMSETVAQAPISTEQAGADLTQEQAIDQVISYNANGINAIPVFNTSNNSWKVQVIDTPVKEAQPVKYSI